ncbi:MAG: DUF2089 family protein [Planctomycetota bacterium]
MAAKKWLEYLSDEDLAFVRRLVLASGSLKKVAQQYGVTYPTIRLRLDRLIAKIEAVEDAEQVSHFERLLRAQFADGRISHETFRDLLAAHRQDLEDSENAPDHPN